MERPLDSRQPGFVRVDNRIITLYANQIGSTALAVYVVLSFHANNKTRQCYPSTRKIARLLDLSQPTVLKAIRTLEEAGLVHVRRVRTKQGDRRANVYTLLPICGAKESLSPVLNDVEQGAKGVLAEQDSINKTQENKRESAPAERALAGSALAGPTPTGQPPTDTHGHDPNLDNAAVQAYRQVFKLTPNEMPRAEIARVVTDLAVWQEVLRNWQLANYSKQNIPGMLDRYRKETCERSGGNDRMRASGRMRRVGDLVSGAAGFMTGGSRDLKRPPKKPLGSTPSGKPSDDPKLGAGLMDENAYAEKHGLCLKCKGRGFVVLDVPYGHPDFGKLISCKCNGGSPPAPSPFDGLKIPDDVRDATFETAVPLPQIVPVLAVARTLVTPPHGVLTFAGQPGVGKSKVGGCIANAAKSAGIQALYAGGKDLFTRLYEMTKPDSPFAFNSARGTLLSLPVLCIDDLHVLNDWPWALTLLYEIICSRYDDRRKCLACLITNDSIDRWPDYVQSRIRDVECHLFELTGMDVRQRKR